MVVKVIIVTAVVYLLDNFSGHWFNNNFHLATLGFEYEGYAGFAPWQFLTYGFLHAPMEKHIFHVVLNMYGLWLFGSAIESKYGSKEFLALYLGIMVLAGAIWWGITTMSGVSSMIGASGAVAGMTILFALNFP
ncbi:MAG: rhomboid family intramembrane serine protease, partial [Planctomycetota bacterium]